MCRERMCSPKSSGGLGFRQLHECNVAKLGKQGWRLNFNPESLVSRIHRARYYPNGTFFTASIGNNPSYIWLSVIDA